MSGVHSYVDFALVGHHASLDGGSSYEFPIKHVYKAPKKVGQSSPYLKKAKTYRRFYKRHLELTYIQPFCMYLMHLHTESHLNTAGA